MKLVYFLWSIAILLVIVSLYLRYEERRVAPQISQVLTAENTYMDLPPVENGENTPPLKHTPPQPTEDDSHLYHKVLTTFFWVGEKADSSNGFIANKQSAWDGYWMEHFGGLDDPDDRCEYFPCSFTPQENPFYFALPYNDLDKNGARKKSASRIPWFDSHKHKTSVLKNTWIEIRYKNKTCYAQWEDVGPFEEDDFEYVFGTQGPKNTQGVGAGLDVSPAVRDCLAMKNNDITWWKFVDEETIPDGPWKQIVTTSPVEWKHSRVFTLTPL